MGVKVAGALRLTTYHHTVMLSQNLGVLTSQNPVGLLRDSCTFAFYTTVRS